MCMVGVCDGCTLHVHICGLWCVCNVYVCVGHVCVWCVCCKYACVSVSVCPGQPSPRRPPPGCCGSETRPTGCRTLSPMQTFPVHRRRRGALEGFGGPALVGGGGGVCPDEPAPAPASALRASCRRGLSAFSPRGPSVAHTPSSRERGRRGAGGLSVPRARQTSFCCRGRAGAKPLGRKITPISALMAHKVILSSDPGAGLPAFCELVTNPRQGLG